MRQIILWGLILVTSACNIGTQATITEETSPPATIEVNNTPETAGFVRYWVGTDTVAYEDSVQVGCLTYVSPIESNMPLSEATSNIAVSLNKMFTTPPTEGQRNVWAEDLEFQANSVSFENGLATINLTGTIMMRGVCADAEMEAQILLAIFSEESVERALIMVGDTNLRQYFDMSGRGRASADFIYTRENIPYASP